MPQRINNPKKLPKIVVIPIILFLVVFITFWFCPFSLPKTYDECVNSKPVLAWIRHSSNSLYCSYSAYTLPTSLACLLKGGTGGGDSPPCFVKYYNPKFDYPKSLEECQTLKAEVDKTELFVVQIPKERVYLHGNYNFCNIKVWNQGGVYNPETADRILDKCSKSNGEVSFPTSSTKQYFYSFLVPYHESFGICKLIFP